MVMLFQVESVHSLKSSSKCPQVGESLPKKEDLKSRKVASHFQKKLSGGLPSVTVS